MKKASPPKIHQIDQASGSENDLDNLSQSVPTFEFRIAEGLR